eukprot:scaffold222568_cov36-Tisochrysis_lutea.AAC.2
MGKAFGLGPHPQCRATPATTPNIITPKSPPQPSPHARPNVVHMDHTPENKDEGKMRGCGKGSEWGIRARLAFPGIG